MPLMTLWIIKSHGILERKKCTGINALKLYTHREKIVRNLETN